MLEPYQDFPPGTLQHTLMRLQMVHMDWMVYDLSPDDRTAVVSVRGRHVPIVLPLPGDAPPRDHKREEQQDEREGLDWLELALREAIRNQDWVWELGDGGRLATVWRGWRADSEFDCFPAYSNVYSEAPTVHNLALAFANALEAEWSGERGEAPVLFSDSFRREIAAVEELLAAEGGDDWQTAHLRDLVDNAKAALEGGDALDMRKAYVDFRDAHAEFERRNDSPWDKS